MGFSPYPWSNAAEQHAGGGGSWCARAAPRPTWWWCSCTPAPKAPARPTRRTAPSTPSAKTAATCAPSLTPWWTPAPTWCSAPVRTSSAASSGTRTAHRLLAGQLRGLGQLRPRRHAQLVRPAHRGHRWRRPHPRRPLAVALRRPTRSAHGRQLGRIAEAGAQPVGRRLRPHLASGLPGSLHAALRRASAPLRRACATGRRAEGTTSGGLISCVCPVTRPREVMPSVRPAVSTWSAVRPSPLRGGGRVGGRGRDRSRELRALRRPHHGRHQAAGHRLAARQRSAAARVPAAAERLQPARLPRRPRTAHRPRHQTRPAGGAGRRAAPAARVRRNQPVHARGRLVAEP